MGHRVHHMAPAPGILRATGEFPADLVVGLARLFLIPWLADDGLATGKGKNFAEDTVLGVELDHGASDDFRPLLRGAFTGGARSFLTVLRHRHRGAVELPGKGLNEFTQAQTCVPG